MRKNFIFNLPYSAKKWGLRPVFLTPWLLFLIFFATNGWADVVVVKTALITPEGSAWTNMLHEMAEEIEAETGGDVRFKIYAGGISGDELDVIRKMKINRIHAAGFSGVGLGVILPEVRILEAPLLYDDYAEVDLIRETFYDKFSADMAAQGYVLLGFAEAGFTYLFSKTDISNPEWVADAKMWAWKGDPVAEGYFKALGITTFPLYLSDVNTGLETGMIDSFYSPPLGAVAFQWYPKVRFMLDYPMVNSTGALVMKNNVFDKISAENQARVKAVAEKYCRRLIDITRQDNQKAIAVMQQAGVAVVKPYPEQIDLFKERAKTAYEQNTGSLYSKDLFQQVMNTLEENRTTLPGAHAMSKDLPVR